MPIKKTIAGFFVATAFSGAVLASEPTPAALEEAPTGCGRRHDPAAGVQPRSGEHAVAHRLPCLQHRVPVRADIPDRGHPHPQAALQGLGDDVPGQVREQRLAAGDVVVLAAFGGGLTWATGLVRW